LCGIWNRRGGRIARIGCATADGSLETFRTKRLLQLISNRQLVCRGEEMEARGGIEPPIKVLQTFALPLGDRALVARSSYQEPNSSHVKGVFKP
jgi:hypothetical protein